MGRGGSRFGLLFLEDIGNSNDGGSTVGVGEIWLRERNRAEFRGRSKESGGGLEMIEEGLWLVRRSEGEGLNDPRR